MKKGNATVGVERQYISTAGRIENSQVAVYLVHATPRGHAAVDRELYLPRAWTDPPGRCHQAGLDPDEVRFATRTQLAATMLERFWHQARARDCHYRRRDAATWKIHDCG